MAGLGRRLPVGALAGFGAPNDTDESVDGPVVRWLRNLGHDVEWAAESFAGEADEFLARRARDENLTLITSDRDFGELVFRHGLRLPAVVLLRIRVTSSRELVEAFAEQWPQIEAGLVGKFVVVSRGRYRVRPL